MLTSVSLTTEMVAQLDLVAKQVQRSRSWVIRRCVEVVLAETYVPLKKVLSPEEEPIHVSRSILQLKR